MSQPVCAIPGAGPGNGLTLARRFADAGYRVALLARDRERIQTLAAEIDDAQGVVCDVTDAGSVETAFGTIREQLGPITTLLYNAGAAVFGDIDNIAPDDFETAWRVNALGLLSCTRQVLADMRAAGGGNIIVTGATASLRGGANFAGFAAAKAAQHSLAQSMARKLWPENIHVAIAIVDGVIDTPRTRQMLADKGDEFFLDPTAIAESIHHLTEQPRSAWTFELDLRPFAESW